MVGVEQPEKLTGEEVEVGMDITLDLAEVRKDEVVGRARDSVAEKFREAARLETLEAMVDIYLRRMLYSDKELEVLLRERYKSERGDIKDNLTRTIGSLKIEVLSRHAQGDVK